MSERKPFLMRVDPALLEAMQRWANDDLRSLNGQIEFVLRRALQREGRGAAPVTPLDPSDPSDPSGSSDPSSPDAQGTAQGG